MGLLPKFNIYQNAGAPNCLNATETLDALIFFIKKFCMMFSLKFTLSDVTSFPPYYLSGLKKSMLRLE